MRRGKGEGEKRQSPSPSLFLFLLIPYPFWRLLPRRLPSLHWQIFWISFLKSNLVETVKSSHLLLVKNNTLFNFIIDWFMMFECAGFSYTLRKFLSRDVPLEFAPTFYAAGELLSSINYHVFCLFRMGSRRIRKIALKSVLWSCGRASIESSIISK